MADRQVLLSQTDGLVGSDLSPAYRAVQSGQVISGVVARFKKKEDVGSMAKSILKHKIQTLTGRNVKKIEEEMRYQPKDPNEPSMDIDTMRSLASSLILLSNGELEDAGEKMEVEQPPEQQPPPPASKPGRKRLGSEESQGTSGRPVKSGRRSLAVSSTVETPPAHVQQSAKTSRRSISVLPVSSSVPSATPMEETRPTPGRTGRRSLAVTKVENSQNTIATTPRSGRRASLATPSKANGSSSVTNGPSKTNGSADVSLESLAVSCSLGPAGGSQVDQLAVVQEEEDDNMDNPTPMMLELMKKSQNKNISPIKPPAKSPGKVPAPTRASMMLAAAARKAPTPVKVPARPPSPAPRPQFPVQSGSEIFLMSGRPLEDLKLARLSSTLPLSTQFPGAHLTVLHTPADWSPHEVFSLGQAVKKMNREAGLDCFTLLVGTGLENVHMNMEALLRHTKHVQFVTFHREDANMTTPDTGKLRETTCFFLAAFFFPGCDVEGSVLTNQMVRQGYTTCFNTKSTADLEESIVNCFSDSGEWVLDLCCGARELSLAAGRKGRSAIAFHSDETALAKLATTLRDQLGGVEGFREKDGFVLVI